MELFINITISIVAIMMSLFLITLVHEIGHYLVARCIMKEPNVKINTVFFGRPIINTKRFRINDLFFARGYVGGYSDGAGKKSHNIILFTSGGFFVFLLGIPVALYLTGSISLGNFIPFFPVSPLRGDLFSVPVELGFITYSWLSLSTPLDIFSMFIWYIGNLIPIFILIAFVPYTYPLKLHGKLHWNPSDGLWVHKYAFNKVTEKDTANTLNAVNEKADNK
ncbi:MAG: hypothetical protein FWC77_01030 [Defluviitaleaceae bacterium]|nr:hypothetical protein [Defluviitaleaceae bacterium]